MAVQNCILRNVTAHLCLYQSTGTSTINVVDDCMKHRQDVMTSRTDPAWPEFWDFVDDVRLGRGGESIRVEQELLSSWSRRGSEGVGNGSKVGKKNGNCIISVSASVRKEIGIKRAFRPPPPTLYITTTATTTTTTTPIQHCCWLPQ